MYGKPDYIATEQYSLTGFSLLSQWSVKAGAVVSRAKAEDTQHEIAKNINFSSLDLEWQKPLGKMLHG